LKLSPVYKNIFETIPPNTIRMNGLIGKRFSASRINRLHRQEEYYLLWPFQEHTPVAYKGWKVENPPHPEISHGDWQGEFLGTWIDAACITAWHANDIDLRHKIDRMVNDWLATQGEDGYLGTFDEKDRWKSWDLWIQAHDLIGLLSYYWFTGAKETLQASVHISDRVLQDFGPGKKDLHTGPHRGMASSALLEPMIWLYWETGDERYLQFCKWLVDEDWEAPGGPALISSLLSGNGVANTANGKGAEMLICFSGLVELYRATGDDHYLKPVLIAWEDIVQHHLYITGSASTGECFQTNFLLKNDGVYRMGETCVSMTWFYLNLNLGKLTGEGRFYDMAEQTFYNHLLGAQSPDGRGWAYYVGLRDSKRFRWHTDPDCCPSRGIRALAQAPMNILNVKEDGLVVNFYESSEAQISLPTGLEVKAKIETRYPFSGDIKIILITEEPSSFKVYLRLPGWAHNWQLGVNGISQQFLPDKSGYLIIDRIWQGEEQIDLHLEMPAIVLVDALGNNGRVALSRGPLVYAVDTFYLPERKTVDDVILLLNKDKPDEGIHIIPGNELDSMHLVIPAILVNPHQGSGGWQEKERYFRLVDGNDSCSSMSVRLVPFFEAGTADPQAYKDGVWENTEAVTHITYQVWLPYRFK
jgi:uncharacterized protein